ncbi:hypothetical protein SLE2022_289970 [Rubroshorea leprosula]
MESSSDTLCLQLTCENIGKLFASLEKGPTLVTMKSLYEGVMQGIRAMPLKFPGTAFHHAFQVGSKRHVVEETIRMANIVVFVFRLVSQEVEFQGYKIPKNRKVILWLRYLHMNPETFEDPLCFDPERWNEPMKPVVFMAFGGGVRICAGNMLARMQLVFFLRHLSAGYKWELLNPAAEMPYLPNPRPVDGVEVSISAI